MTVLAEASLNRKGKEKEVDPASLPALHWSLGWEQIQALVSDNRQALAWLNNGLVLSAHASLARVCARFVHATPSTPSTTFEFPDPQVDLSPYGPPTVISVLQGSSKDCWVYAYFPPSTEMLSSGNGLACVWDCQPMIGMVTVMSWWLVKRGSAPVAAKWIGQPRDWFIDPDKKEPQRERPLGPILVKAPMLLLVTESNHAEMVYRPDRPPHQFVVLKASLQSTSVCLAGETVQDESPVGAGGTRICTKAAIGLGSDSESIIVATASRLVPHAGPSPGGLDILGITGELEIPSVAGPSSKNVENHPSFEEWGEEQAIALCEVRINTEADPMALETYPLSPINLHWPTEPPSTTALGHASSDSQPVRQLVHLEFGNLVPPTTDKAPESGKSDDIDMTDLFEAKPEEDDSVLQLIASFMEFKDFSSPPRSILKQWRLRRSTEEELQEIGLVPDPTAPDWLIKQGPTRFFDSTVVSIVRTLPGVDAYHLYAAFMKCSGKVAAGRTETVIGSVKVLDLDLEDDLAFAETLIPAQRNTLGETGFSSSVEHLTFIRMPQRQSSPSETNPHLMGISLAENIVLARLKNSEATDIYLAFWTGFTQGAEGKGDEASAATQLLQEAWSILNPKPAKKFEQEKAGVATSSAEIGDNATIDWQLMGLTLGLYRSCPNPTIAARWVAANTMIRLQVLRESFSDLTPVSGGQTDPDQTATKQLIALTSEVVELTEALLREAIVWEAWRECGSSIKTEEAQTSGPVPAFILLSLVHRHTARLFQDVLNLIIRFGQRLVAFNNPARRLVAGMLGDSKMDFRAVIDTHNSLHEKCTAQMQGIPRALWFLRFSTFSLSIPPELTPVLNTLTEGFFQKSGLVHKMSLLVPSLEYPILDTEEKKAALQAAKLRHPVRAVSVIVDQELVNAGRAERRAKFKNENHTMNMINTKRLHM
ncbi:hypothetical protein FS837_003735 [Tulasnella sp. UAMH 9824]|nr:hypothetical protein FS837_003735 [Tulasnella sp. UAMH 9824]